MSDTELLDRSEPVCRLEVLTGAGRRRRWSAEGKAAIVAESYAHGETVCAVARRHGLTPQQLFVWRRHARQAQKGGLAFAPIVVAAANGPLGHPAFSASKVGPVATIEIMIGATTIRVPPGADAMTLQAVLRAVRAIS